MTSTNYDRPIRLFTGKTNPIEDVSNRELEEQTFPTLQDLSMVMDSCIYDGVTDNLASEIAKSLNVTNKEAYLALSNIRDKYIEMTDKEALNEFWKSESPK
mgnify:FL=1